ncbi:MAG: gliding motility-associated C-terminal domain-containing protein [Bacteroidales bacterium]|jgi:gliding motility-associated-like protein|nr:gliding motility-associated C-terminal domain-containing protein [Bacteroidales bacterium]
MKHGLSSILILFLGILFCLPLISHAKKRDTLSSSSVEFIENQRQWHENVLFAASLHGGSIFFEKNCVTFALLNADQLALYHDAKSDPTVRPPQYVDAVAYKTHFVGANPEPKTHGDGEYPFYHNYYLGNNPENWSSLVKVFEGIHYQDIYNGIDLRYYQHESYLKYDFIVMPGYNPHVIELEYEGIKSLSVSNQNLIVNTAIGSYMELRPFAYQLLPNGDTVQVSCQYHVNKNRVTFTLGEYKTLLPLIIDPVLVFSSYTGATADNWGFTATYDQHGNTYAGGIVFGTGYPTTTGAYQVNYAGGSVDISISKFNATGTALLYSTYLGGTEIEIPNSLIVNGNNELYVLGTTSSANFPITSGTYQTVFKGGSSVYTSSSLNFDSGSDIVIVKFNSDGTQLLASTFVGGSGNDGLNTALYLRKNYADESRGEIMVDDHSNVYVTSSTCSSDFPATAGVFQRTFGSGSQDGCLIKMNHNLSNMIWASFLGGSQDDAGYSIDIAKDKTIYVSGGTNSANFPVTANAIQRVFAGNHGREPDGFVAHIDEFGTQLIHSTFLGSAGYDQVYMVKTDREGYPHVFGQTYASGNFWIRNAAWYTLGGGQFVSKLNPGLSDFVWSTAFGRGTGTPDISPSAFLVDVCDNVYMSGWGGNTGNQGFGGTSGLPVTRDAIQPTTDGNDYYLICISGDASSLVYATFFGSPNKGDHVDGGTSRFDKKGTVYQAVCAGCEGVDNFPTTPGAWSETNGSGNCNLAVFKIDFGLAVIIADFTMPNTVCAPVTIEFANTSQLIEGTSSCFWDFGDGTTSTQPYPFHEYTTSGTYDVTLIVTDLTSCNGTDTMTKRIMVLGNTLDTLSTIYLCDNQPVQIGFAPGQDTALTYRWEPPTGLSNPNISNPIANIAESIIYTLYISNGVCFDTLVHVLEQGIIDFTMSNDTTICPGESVFLNPIINSDADYYLWSTSSTFDPILNDNTSVPGITVSPYTTTTYYFRVGMGNCFSTASMTIDVSNLSLSLPDTISICPHEQAVIQANYTGGQCAFLWDSTSSIVSGYQTGTITVAPLTTTSYILEMINEHGCRLRDTTVAMVFEDLFYNGLEAWANTNSIIQGDTVILYSTLYPNNFTYQWIPTIRVSNSNAHTTMAKPEQSTTYTVIASDINGCQRSDTVFIFVEEISCRDPHVYVPNAFTPNHDGLNDVLRVRSNIVDHVLFTIYNRWGEKIFESTRLEDGWDGTWKGQDAPAGVYDYYMEVRCIGNRTYTTKGNVTLIR